MGAINLKIKWRQRRGLKHSSGLHHDFIIIHHLPDTEWSKAITHKMHVSNNTSERVEERPHDDNSAKMQPNYAVHRRQFAERSSR